MRSTGSSRVSERQARHECRLEAEMNEAIRWAMQPYVFVPAWLAVLVVLCWKETR